MNIIYWICGFAGGSFITWYLMTERVYHWRRLYRLTKPWHGETHRQFARRIRRMHEE